MKRVLVAVPNSQIVGEGAASLGELVGDPNLRAEPEVPSISLNRLVQPEKRRMGYDSSS